MNLNELKEKAIDSELLTITSGIIEAKTSTYTQNSNSNHGNLECVINAYYFVHPKHGGILIDGGFSSDFNEKPPYGNLNFIMKFFQKLNGVKYIQSKHIDTPFQLQELNAKPDHVYLTHRHPDHTSAISQLPDHVSVSYGKGEKDARESAEKIRAFSSKYPEVEVCYSHDLQHMMFKVKAEKIRYTDISKIPPNYTDKMNREYNWMAKGYDAFMIVFPLWKKWIKKVIPHIEGKKILEVSFGSGFLMKQYASDTYEIHGIDYNEKMLEITRKKMEGTEFEVHLSRGNVEELPYPDNTFDTLINTMAFTGYPDGDKAISELKRVLKPQGKLILVDFDYPADRNVFGYYFVRLWEKFGDIIKDINALLRKHGFSYESSGVGGFGSVQLFIAIKQA